MTTLLPKDIMTLYTFLAIVNLACSGVLLLLRRVVILKILWGIAPFLWLAQLLCHFSHTSPYSLSGIAPTCAIAAIVLLLCQHLSLRHDLESARPRYTALFLLLLAMASLVNESVRHNPFMMTYIFAILFFLSRPFSLGCTLYALSGMACLLTTDKTDTRIRRTSKDATFAASIFFLGGEIVGCYWGFMGWGTTWRWSGNFLFSAMFFVLFMVALHVPPHVFRSRRGHDILFSVPLLLIALFMVMSKVLQ
ncbi:MAG: hypothetical protein CSA34_04690 [Desulfobulbus propionicus]|nr:MAG: hypothetical protein CSA34_04690 [Desulfobulbus propionicus]